MLENKVLKLQPSNYYTLNEELCFWIGPNVVRRFGKQIDDLVSELLYMDYLTVCRHVVDSDRGDYYIFMTTSFMIFAMRSEKNNFAISSINSGREVQGKKEWIYRNGVFLITVNRGTSVVLVDRKYTSCNDSDDSWGMEYETLFDLCSKIDDYFFSKENDGNQQNKVGLKFEKQVLTPLKNYTHYEFLAEQLAAYGDDYVLYDRRSNGRGAAKRKVFSFYSRTLDPENEHYQVGDSVAIETNEDINDELKRKVNGRILDRELVEDGVKFDIEVMEQLDDAILPESGGRFFIRANETQKRVRENVISKIYHGEVESKYMYQLFSDFKTAGYEAQPGWNEFYNELMKEKYPPNRSQMEAIKRGIETKDIQLVLGPPGTGKTTVIVSWIKFFIGQGKRVLISSQNNSAVDNVLERVGKNKAARVIRLGNIDKIQENCKQYSTERQVDSTAEKYLERLSSTTEALEKDISAIHEAVRKVDELIPLFEEYCRRAKAVRVYSSKMNGAVSQMAKLYNDIELLKNACEQKQIEMIRKGIALRKAEGMGFIWRLLHLGQTRFLRKTRAELKRELNQSINQICTKQEEYNTLMKKMISEVIKDKGYISNKKLFHEMKRQIKGEDIVPAVSGLYQVPQFRFDNAFIDPDRKMEELRNYKPNLLKAIDGIRYLIKTLNDWESSVNSKRNEIVTDLLIQNSNVVGATCIGINTRSQFRNLSFDVSIIDESGQIQIHNAIVPMSRAPKTLMLGDHLQIPPVASDVVESLCKNDGVKTDLLEMSFFEYLFTKLEKRDPDVPNLTRLDEQFRMPGNISDVISGWFYGGNYHAHYDMSKWKPIIAGTNSPLILITTSGVNGRFEQGPNDSKDGSPGYCNPLEAEITANIIRYVFAGAEVLDNEQVGVISAYGKQVRYIRDQISSYKLGFKQEQIHSMVASLDSFQGQERPLIIYSSTRSTNYKKPEQARVGFMKELRRLNVAFTRCQKQLVIIGDFDYLTSCEYEELDPVTNEPLPNKSEKAYSAFIQRMVDQAKSKNGEFYTLQEFYDKVGVVH